MFQGNLKGFSRKFKGCFKGVLRVLQGRFGSFMSVLRLFQGSLKHIKSLSKKVCFVVVVVADSRAEGGLVFLVRATQGTSLYVLTLSVGQFLQFYFSDSI